MVNEKLDLIDRKALIVEYDRVHIGPPGGARKLMEDAPPWMPWKWFTGGGMKSKYRFRGARMMWMYSLNVLSAVFTRRGKQLLPQLRCKDGRRK